MTGLVINNFTQTHDGQQTAYNGRAPDKRLEIRTMEDGAQRTISVSPTEKIWV